jgi:hypothetical protein
MQMEPNGTSLLLLSRCVLVGVGLAAPAAVAASAGQEHLTSYICWDLLVFAGRDWHSPGDWAHLPEQALPVPSTAMLEQAAMQLF